MALMATAVFTSFQHAPVCDTQLPAFLGDGPDVRDGEGLQDVADDLCPLIPYLQEFFQTSWFPAEPVGPPLVSYPPLGQFIRS